jgi:methylenetetrahydrofolate dehydrogenase (NADP+)/methenyltetrahydrofolate cyclohydrolase
MALILNGKIARDALAEELSAKIKKCEQAPMLVIIQVGDRADSNSYIRQKKLFAERIGAKIVHRVYPEKASQDEILKEIEKNNKDKNIDGIIVQMPLPVHLDKQLLIEAVDPHKDVDGLTLRNAAHLYSNNPDGFVPATAQGIVSLLHFYNIPIEGKHVVVVGRSALVGKPTALALLNLNATVTLAHKYTEHLQTITKSADILIVAIGDPLFITQEYISPGQVVVDVGINAVDGALRGDVAFTEAEPIVAAISPVPGGVGPMTVLSLFQNLYTAYLKLHK